MGGCCEGGGCGAPAPAPVAAAAGPSEAELAGLGVKELKRLAKERGVDTTGLLEKQEFVKALAAAPASASMPRPPPAATAEAPTKQQQVGALAPKMGELLGKTLLKGQGRMESASLGGHIIGIYFSAHWCGPCRQFTPRLAQFYEEVRSAGKRFEVVFVSSDRSPAQFREYFQTHPWAAIPYDNDEREEAMQTFQVRGIPHLVIYSAAGKVRRRGRGGRVEGGLTERLVRASCTTRWARR